MRFDHGVAKTSGSTGLVITVPPAIETLGILARSMSPRIAMVAAVPVRADDRHDLVLLDELAGRGDGLGVVGGVVLDDQLDLAAVDAAGVVDLLDFGLEHVLLGLAQGGVGTGEGDDRADLDRLAADRRRRCRRRRRL